MDLFSFIGLAKYILIGIGAIGLLIIIIGLVKNHRELIIRGLFLSIAIIVIFICASFIRKITMNKVNEGLFDPYLEEYYQDENEIY